MRALHASFLAFTASQLIMGCGGSNTDAGNSANQDFADAAAGDSTATDLDASVHPPDQGTPLDATASDSVTFQPIESGSDSTANPICVSEDFQPELIPPAMFIMLDQSTSMAEMLSDGNSRWKDVTDAINTFLSSNLSPSLIGLQYFGLDGDGPGLCDVATYDSADVAMGPVNTTAPVIATSLTNHGPTGVAATAPAIQGGLQYLNTFAALRPDVSARFVLITDTLPTACSPQDPAGLAMLAAGPDGGPDSAQFYIIAMGQSAADLATLAAVGHAFRVTDTSTKDQVVQALTDIAFPSVPCEVMLPLLGDGGTLDPALLGVWYRRNGGLPVPVVVDRVADASACAPSGHGFFLNDALHPTALTFCEGTCSDFRNSAIYVTIGCVPPGADP